MVIKDLERRNSEYALIESRRESLNRPETVLNENELSCVANWIDTIVSIKKAMQEVAKKSKNYEDAAVRNKIKYLNKSWMNVLCSMIGNHKQWVY